MNIDRQSDTAINLNIAEDEEPYYIVVTDKNCLPPGEYEQIDGILYQRLSRLRNGNLIRVD